MHSTGHFTGKNGIDIFTQTWTPATPPQARLVIAHGLGEHSGRYDNLIQALSPLPISIHALDHRGHGKSAGKRGHINAFSDYTEDLNHFLDKIATPPLPTFVLGHSLGGLIALVHALDHPHAIAGLILSAPGIIPCFKVPELKKQMGLFFSRVWPTLSMDSGLPPQGLSHDPEVITAYQDDPLVHNQVTARFYAEVTRAQTLCLKQACQLKMPLLIFHGSKDPLVDPKGSLVIHEKAASPDKGIRMFDDLFHEPMNETLDRRQGVLELVKDWIEDHMAPMEAPL